MGGVVKAVTKAVGSVFGIDPGAQEDAMREAAEKQAAATREAAERQAAATKVAAEAQASQTLQRQQASAAAMQATINQNTMAARAAAEAPKPEAAPKVDIALGDDDAADPRRKYQSKSNFGSNGVGIKLT